MLNVRIRQFRRFVSALAILGALLNAWVLTVHTTSTILAQLHSTSGDAVVICHQGGKTEGQSPNPRSLVWGGSIQYSMPYLKSAVVDAGLPDFVNRLIPLVEWSLQTQTDNFDGEERTTGTINPGLIYVGDKFQLSGEAIIPVNRESGDGVGGMGQLHLYLDDIFPDTYGQPLFASSQQ
jgi:hypothetical protein